MNLIECNNISKCYDMKVKERVYAVSDISLKIKKGEIVGLVGESGCGKSTLGKILLKLEQATDGKIIFKGNDITNYSFKEMKPIRRNMQMIFQNSSNAFNPYFTVRQIIEEPINNYIKVDNKQKEEMIIDILNRVGLDEKYLSRYVSELSGGQRQRVGIARALVIKPEFVVCDEPTSSIDYAIRNQILDLLMEFKQELGLTYLFISHDISAINKICTSVLVMYLGNIMEIIPSMNDDILHPYSKALMAATLDINPRNKEEKKILFKDDYSVIPEKGCIFQNRCLYAEGICKNKKTTLTSVDENCNHYVACHLCNKK